MKSLEEIAEHIIKQLKRHGITIQRYDAYSTNSIYLKFDFGVSNSLRISDHGTSKDLSYRFNLLTNIDASYKKVDEKSFQRHFYSMNEVDQLISDISNHRMYKLMKYGLRGYNKFMDINKSQNEKSSGFWQSAVVV